MLNKIKKFFDPAVKKLSLNLINANEYTVEKRLANHRSKILQYKINEEKKEARSLTQKGLTKEAAVQWDIVEELCAEAADRSAYEKFCDENPGDHNCRMYDV